MDHWSEEGVKIYPREKECQVRLCMITSPTLTCNNQSLRRRTHSIIYSNDACRGSSSIIIASSNSNDSHNVIYYNIHVRNNSPLHASSNKTATQKQQQNQLTEIICTTRIFCINITHQTKLIGIHFIIGVQRVKRKVFYFHQLGSQKGSNLVRSRIEMTSRDGLLLSSPIRTSFYMSCR